MEKFNFKLIYRFLGITAMLNGIFMLFAIPFSLFHKEDVIWGILNAGIVTLIIGALLFFFNVPKNKNLQKKEGYLIVTLGWLILSATGALPLSLIHI